jgi:glycosyltransferase involved in cell wall biosynthesis
MRGHSSGGGVPRCAAGNKRLGLMQDPLVKVVVTTYNRRDWAAIAIDSVLAQTHRSSHLVIVDDASTDGTGDLLRGYQTRHPDRVRAICKPKNRGLADSLIQGLRAPPDAEFVAILNDDDVWLPTKLERQLEWLDAHPELALVYCDAEVINEEGRPTGELFSDRFGKLDRSDVFADLFRANHACASTPLLRHEIAALAVDTIPDPSIVSDYYLMLLAAGYGAVDFIGEPLALYRDVAAGLHRADHRMWRDTTHARRELFARHPTVVQRVGGGPAARRMTALQTIHVAMLKLKERAWREYLWHSGVILTQRSPRAIGALLRHTAKELLPKRLVGGEDAKTPQ